MSIGVENLHAGTQSEIATLRPISFLAIGQAADRDGTIKKGRNMRAATRESWAWLGAKRLQKYLSSRRCVRQLTRA